MKMKFYIFLLFSAALLACKPAVQATPVESLGAKPLAHDTLPEVQHSGAGAEEPADSAYDDEGEIRSRSPKNITEEYYSCVKNVGYNTVESMTCMSAEKRRQDQRLNAAYKKLQGSLAPEAKKALIESQRASLKFRDAVENFEASISEGEIIENAQLTESELFRLCSRANELEAHVLYADLR